MLFSLVLPTRKRPKDLKRLISSINETADNKYNIEVCIYYDSDDNETILCIDELRKEYPIIIKSITQNEKKMNICEMWNFAYGSLSSGEIIMLCADDVEFTSKSWDTAIMSEFMKVEDRILLVYGDDNIQSGKLATLPFLHRNWIECVGYWLPPYFAADWCDTWLFEIATKINRYKYLPDVKTTHHHYSITSVIDETTRNKLDKANVEKPQEIYASKQHERDEGVAKLLNCIENYKNTEKNTGSENYMFIIILFFIFTVTIIYFTQKKILKKITKILTAWKLV